MPMKTHIMIRIHCVTWLETLPSPSPPAAAMRTALRSAVPQKSAVKMPALKLTMEKAMKSRIVATLTTMTTAFRKAALSTPRMTR